MRYSVYCCLFVFLGSWLSIPITVVASSSSKAAPNTNAPALSSLKNSTSLVNSTKHSRIKIVETQVWDGSKWQPAQWMDSSGENAVPSPDDTPLPSKASKWISGWKIVVGESKDGWKYTWKRPHQGIRERIWLRSYEIKKISAKNSVKPRTKRSSEDTEASSDETEESVVVHRGPYFETPQWMQAVRDDFNFKGFGWTFYKSLLRPTSAGVAFRFPITFNFDTFDRNPQLPSCSGSVAVYNDPWCIGLFLTMSFRLEFLQWLTRRIAERTAAAVLWVIWILFVRNLGMCFSLLTYPVTQEWKQLAVVPEYVSTMWTRGGVEKPQYKRTVEERLGCSASWRLTQGKGFEFRRSCWHSVAPTLTSLWEESLLGKFFLGDIEPPAWLLRHSGTLGISNAAPTPTEPYFSSNAILSLSGFYFKHRGVIKRKNNQIASKKKVVPTSRSPETQETDLEFEEEESDDLELS
ncbi:hypothetical protein FisN_6Hh202 [Fistulifera solaris]|uniref:Peroxin/Ferlin domain-containing protein n=1 Tax=Fistulifera solaris TaxID=1519565 RepID=A0A1Z5KF30_FISSO|nr:hypothetical protein FisN_6Hh202 [Fistulifera solaris]|eukprot:GAX24849.1 hypothetical protein FisN_6Hh202 [Fistulifera solaris]